MHLTSSRRLQARTLIAALLILTGSLKAGAFDTFSGGQISIPSVTIGGATFSNMVVTLGTIVTGPSGTTPNGTQDSYNPANNQLNIPAVLVGSNIYYNVIITVESLISPGSVTGADVYNGSFLTIPSVQIQGGGTFSNVVVTVGGIVSTGGGMPRNSLDVYNRDSNQLTIAAVQVGGTVYTNAIVTVGNIGSVGGNVTGVAASSMIAVGSQVTLKDAAGHSASTTTTANGAFTIGVSGMTAPFLLQVTDGATTLYSYSPGSGVANANPYTTMALQSYYTAQGEQIGSVFAGTLTPSSFPQASQLALLAQPLAALLQPYLANAGVPQPQSFSPFTSPFIANHTGFDRVLDRTAQIFSPHQGLTVDNGSGTTAGPLSATVSAQVTAGNGTTLAVVAVNTAATNSSANTNSSSQQLVPVGISTAQQTALAQAQAGVLALFGHIAQLVAAANGGAVSTGQIAPYIDSNFLDQGVNAAAFAAQLASHFSGVPAGTAVTASIARVNKFNPVSETLDATVDLTFTNGATISSGNYLDDNDNAGYGIVYKQEAGGGWDFYGQQTEFDAHVSLSGTLFYNANAENPNSPSTNLFMMAQVPAAVGVLSGVSVSGPGNSLPNCANPPTFALSQVQLVQDPGLYNGEDRFDLPMCQGALTGPPPPVGSIYTFSLTEAAGPTVVQQTYPLNAETFDYGDITQINGVSRATFAAANPVAMVAGTTLAIDFTPPTTYPYIYSYLTAFCQNASQVESGGGTDLNNSAGNSAAGVTSGTLVIPAQCSGAAPVTLTIGVNFVGIDGQNAQVQQQLLTH
jgi:hypothetical protein